jgi:hypothetical protein
VNLRPPFDTRDVVEKLLHLADFVKLNNDELFANCPMEFPARK